MSLEEKVKTAVAYMTLGVVIFATITLFVWWFWPYKTIETEPRDGYEIVAGVDHNNCVKQGGVITYSFDYVKYTDVPPQINKRFVDGLVFQAVTEEILLPPGEGTAYVETNIPMTLPPGTYTLEVIRRFKVNPIRTIIVTGSTEKFTVTER